MTRRRLAWVLAAVQVAAAVTLGVAPFLTAQGPSGPVESYPGTLLHLTPVYGALVIAAAVAISP